MHLASLPSKRAGARPDSLCLSDEAVGTLTSNAFAARVEAASRVLAAHGVTRGTVVAVRLPNRTDLVVALFAQDGSLGIVDRVKDMIIRGGENICPQEIEHAIHAHPAVLEVAVVGRPHLVMGEEPVAFVALKDGASLDEDELVAFLTQRIAKFKLPTSVTFIDEVPKNSLGESDKPRLRTTIASTSARAAGPGKETS